MSEKRKVYLETTITSYLMARRSRDLIMAACQELTREWWSCHQHDYLFFASQVVIRESSVGDPDAAARRLEFLRPFPLLEITGEVERLATRLVRDIPLPLKAQVDALHIALAAVHQMDYLVTWNCTHIANATLRTRLEAVCRSAGFPPPVVCTPQELLGSDEPPSGDDHA